MKRIISLILVFSMVFGITVVFAGNNRTISRIEQMKHEQMKFEQALLSVEKQFAGQSEAFREKIKSAITESYLRRMSKEKNLDVVGEGIVKSNFVVSSSAPFMTYSYTASVSMIARRNRVIGSATHFLGGALVINKVTWPLAVLSFGLGVIINEKAYTIGAFETGTEFRGKVRMYWTDEVNFEYRGIDEGRFVFNGRTLRTTSRTWSGDFNE